MATTKKKAVPVEPELAEQAGPPKKDELKEQVESFVVGFTMDAAVRDQLLTLVKGILLSSANAGLVHLGDNIGTVDFGRFKGTIVAVVEIAVRELRNILNGGVVADGTMEEAE